VATDREARRQKALATAQEMLKNEGLSKLSMRRLARASNMAVNTLYAMFSTRDGVLMALVQEAITRRMAFIQTQVADVDSPVMRIQTIVSAGVHHAIGHPVLTKPMYRAAADLHLRGLRHAASQVGADFIARTMEEAVQAGQLRADVVPRQLAEMLMLVVHEVSLAWALDEISDDELVARCHHAMAVVLTAAAHPNHLSALQARLQETAADLADVLNARTD